MDEIKIIEELKTLGHIGFQSGMGTTRLAYSKDYIKGRKYIEQLMKDVGLKISLDSVGNLSGVLDGTIKKRIAVGSHLDTVPNGGIYDGALGVIAAIECVREFQKIGYKNRHTIEVIAFTEEEGNVIGGTFGSRCFAGQKIEPMEYKKMYQYYICYLEYHIEQGGVLDNENKTIGIVEGIVGIIRFRATVQGTANHAGTTPMKLRDDAVVKACKIISDITDCVRCFHEDMVCTVGNIWVPNGAANVVPGECSFILELRGKSLGSLYQPIEYIRKKYKSRGLMLEQILEQHETEMDKEIVDLSESVCMGKRVSYKKMFSGAGHDAMNMALITPCGMIFVPSANGMSHNPQEYTDPKDILEGKNVLKEIILKIDAKGKKNDDINKKRNIDNSL
jgi:acetylornithine deacetylase/succinyl-diaminopimelate desuccinylase-like protein